MLRTLSIVLCALCINLCLSQSKIEQIIKSPVHHVDEMEHKNLKSKVFLKTEFNKAEFISVVGLKKIKGKTVTQIDLVFTTFKEHISFDQLELNKQRLITLSSIAPALFTEPLIKWTLVGQRRSRSSEEAKKHFHGFVIHYRNSDAISRKMEIDYLEKHLLDEGPPPMADSLFETSLKESSTFLRAKVLSSNCPEFNYRGEDYWKYMIRHLKYPESAIKSKAEGLTVASAIVDSTGRLKNITIESSIGKAHDTAFVKMLKGMPNWIPAKEKDSIMERKVMLPAVFDLTGKLNYIEMYNYYKSTRCRSVPTYSYVKDRTIHEVFNRNPKWKNMLVVTDVTGSMYPYIAQLLVWHQLNLKTKKDKVKQITFFNDGDTKRVKPIGSTGGIYHSKSRLFEDFKEVLYKAMKAGGGGDCPENNIEAVLKAIKKCPEGEDIVMIADNYATPRDLSLAAQIKRPVKIILCGASVSTINISYLNLARKLKGSIHTMSDDIIDLASKNEGESIFLSGIEFKIVKGKFEQVYSI